MDELGLQILSILSTADMTGEELYIQLCNRGVEKLETTLVTLYLLAQQGQVKKKTSVVDGVVCTQYSVKNGTSEFNIGTPTVPCQDIEPNARSRSIDLAKYERKNRTQHMCSSCKSLPYRMGMTEEHRRKELCPHPREFIIHDQAFNKNMAKAYHIPFDEFYCEVCGAYHKDEPLFVGEYPTKAEQKIIDDFNNLQKQKELAAEQAAMEKAAEERELRFQSVNTRIDKAMR